MALMSENEDVHLKWMEAAMGMVPRLLLTLYYKVSTIFALGRRSPRRPRSTGWVRLRPGRQDHRTRSQ